MLVGYIRVSTEGDRQVLDLQRDALLAAGVDERHLYEGRDRHHNMAPALRALDIEDPFPQMADRCGGYRIGVEGRFRHGSPPGF